MPTARKSGATAESFIYTCPYCGTRSNASLCTKRECRRKYYADVERRRADERSGKQPVSAR